MAVSNELIKELAVLMNGRNPSYSVSGTYDSTNLPDPPGTSAAGIDLGDAVVCMIDVQLRRNPSYKSAWVTITGVDIGETYTVTIDGTAYTYTASGSDAEEEILDGLATDLAGASAVVDVVVENDGSTPTLKITGVTADDYTCAVSVSGGTAAIEAVVDASTVDFEIWACQVGDTDGSTWCLLNEAQWTEKTSNWRERLYVAGSGRLFIRPTASDGRVVCKIGPCVLE